MFSILTDGGRQTRAVATFLPETDTVLSWMGMRIEQVALSGQRFTSDADVFEAIDIPTTGSLVTFDAAQARERIEKLPWVSTAAISRIFPGALDVRITERQPSALWIDNGREYLVDDSGRVLSALKKGTNVKLPRLSGDGAPAQAQALLDLIVRFPRIAERFEMAERVGERRWTLHLKSGVVVHLGADREAVALAALSSPDELGKLIDTPNTIVDLRARGRITVRAAPSARSRHRHPELVEERHAQPRQDRRQKLPDRRPARYRDEQSRLHHRRARSAGAAGRKPARARCSASGICARAV